MSQSTLSMLRVPDLGHGYWSCASYGVFWLPQMYYCAEKWYTYLVPTTRPRYQVTETPQVAHALDQAAKRWPGEPRSKLLRRLIEVGAGILERDERAED
ncbi:hypothetical protein [Mycobacterium leprae]|nr:hypothetical protein [Mycobacterium leprae]